MQSANGGAIKIGTTGDVDRRRVELERTYGTSLVVLAVFQGGREEESLIHERFSHLRLGKTEQFRPAPDLMKFLGRPLLVGSDSEAVEVMKSVDPNPIIFQMRGSQEWKDWLAELAEYDGRTLASLARRVLKRYAKEIGFTEEAPPH